jgi:peptidoglycan/xylan/chitin deacetylase (PgdA/CDA1 family)
MYHRIATPASNIWNITVEPTYFEQHARVLKASYHVISTTELVESIARRKVRKNSVALTFDDGYADNFLVAKPILDHYGLPATFFITSHYTDLKEEFWWDELEHLVLFSVHLPSIFSQTISGQIIEFSLGNEACLSPNVQQQHQHWDASEAPPTARCALFLRLWQSLRPLPYPEQQLHLQRIRQWAGVAPSERPDYRSMSLNQLQSLNNSTLHQLGMHTVSHPALASHPLDFQRQELLNNQYFVEKAAGKKPGLLAYPYGNYNQETLAAVREIGCEAAFTTEEETVNRHSDKYRLGRFQVPNCTGTALAQRLKLWQKGV